MLIPLVLQGTAFFLLFQPGLLMRKRARRAVLGVVLGVLCLILFYGDVDPFVWLLYVVVVLLVYRTARNALSWAFRHRLASRERVQSVKRELDVLSGATGEKERFIASLEEEIEKVSRIYERLKDMSGSLDVLGVFLNFSQAILENISVGRTKILLLRSDGDQEKVIDRVYQMDRERLNFTPADRMLMSDDVMFRGELYPLDVRVLECVKQEGGAVYFPPPGEEGEDTVEPEAPGGLGKLGRIPSRIAYTHRLIQGLDRSLMGYPIRMNGIFEALLVIEEARGADLGVIGILADRFTAEYKRVRLYQDVQRLATTDWLTNLYVRRYFFTRLEEEIKRCERYNLIFSFLMIDIDDFKTHNDRYGHLVGDAILRETAQLIRDNVREVDLVGRYGGEEFSAILIDTDQDQAMFIAERIRKSIAEHRFHIYDEELHLTVSIGFATYSSRIRGANEMVERADSSLYQAKRQGKNRVCAYIKGTTP